MVNFKKKFHKLYYFIKQKDKFMKILKIILFFPVLIIGTIIMLIGAWLLKSGEYIIKKIGTL